MTSDDCMGQPCVSGQCQTSSDGGTDGMISLGGDNTNPNGGSLANGGSLNNGGSTVSGGMNAGGDNTGPTGSPAGSGCKVASDCASGKCDGGLCMPDVPLPNTTCKTGPDCASGVCKNGACVIPAGASGMVDTGECTAGSLGCMCQPMNKCKPGLTCTSGTCCNAKTGSCDSGTMMMGAGGSDSGPPPACKPGVVGTLITECGYPYASKNALTDILFNESPVLAAIVPSGGYPLASVQLFYNDEHAMTLGVHEANILGKITMFPVSPLTKSPDIVDSPQTGTNLITGQLAGVDPVGRPMWPALFVTDITQDTRAVYGDWQWGGAPINPSYVAGTWKGATRTVDAMGASITPDVDPLKNMQNYGNGHTAPAGSITKAEAYGAEVRWDIRLEPGHNYRFQVMVHDGDQNKIGGDSGEACVTFCAGSMCPTDVLPCSTDKDCTNGDVCSDGCCIPPPPDGSGGAGTGTGTGGEGTGGGCPPEWKVYTANGVSTCTPPPTNGGCPLGYVLTIQNGQQYCTEERIR